VPGCRQKLQMTAPDASCFIAVPVMATVGVEVLKAVGDSKNVVLSVRLRHAVA